MADTSCVEKGQLTRVCELCNHACGQPNTSAEVIDSFSNTHKIIRITFTCCDCGHEFDRGELDANFNIMEHEIEISNCSYDNLVWKARL